jgi:hypothetical protein
MINSLKPTPVKSWAWINDHAEEVPLSAEELQTLYETDRKMTKFQVAGLGIEFSCVPSQTTNFDIFRYTNPELTKLQAQEIWSYYRDQFISAKLAGHELSKFRQTLWKFILGEAVSKHVSFPNNLANKQHSRKEYIEGIINLGLWLGLQYKVDKLVEEINNDRDPDLITKNFGSFLTTIATKNNYTSYFYKEPEFANYVDFSDRTLFLKKKLHYNHKSKHTFVCESEYGAVVLNMSSNTSTGHTLPLLDRLLTQGTDVVITGGKVQGNINDSVRFLKVYNWFLE